MSVAGLLVDRTAQTIQGFTNATISLTASTAAVGTAVSIYPLRIGARGDAASSFQDFELLAVAVFRRALTATEIATINTYYGTA